MAGAESNGSGCLSSEVSVVSNSSACRIWADGCYDLAHFGHANSFRQAKLLGDYLVVGVHSDEDIKEHKSTPPVFTEKERYAMVRAVKWVDEVVEAAPYVTTIETLDENRCQYCAHGDDITTTLDGTDTYQLVKDAKRYKEVSRTQGVSTTELIRRMLHISKMKDVNRDLNNNELKELVPPEEPQPVQTKTKISPWTGRTKFFLTIDKIKNFSNRSPNEDDKIVYVTGSFDLLHPGHLKFLEKAKELGTYLIVGIHADLDVNLFHGSAYPVMTLHERFYTLLGCRYVDDVVIGAPLQITSELLDHLKISVVAHGKIGTSFHPSTGEDLYDEPRQRNILHEIDSGSSLTTQEIVARVGDRRMEYEERNRKKEEKEANIVEAQSLAQPQL